MRGARVADSAREIVGHGLGLRADRACGALRRAPVRTGHDHALETGHRDARLLERFGHRRLRQGNVDVLAKSLFPLVRCALAGDTPPLEELGARRCERDRLGDDRARDIVAAQERDRRIPAVALVATRRKSGADVGEHGQRRPTRVEGGPERTRTRAYRADHVERARVRGQADRRVDCRRVGLVEIPRVCRREIHRGGRDARRAAQRRPRRFDAHGRAVFIEGGDGARALARGNAESLADGGAIEAVVRDVDAVREKPVHEGSYFTRRFSSSSRVLGQSWWSRRESARSARSRPPVWQRAQ